ncbi:hypothetical protein ACFL5S_02285 [Fibrobacterota bacterium]
MDPLSLLVGLTIKAAMLMGVVWLVARKYANFDFMNMFYTMILIGFIAAGCALLLYPIIGALFVIPVVLLSAIVITKLCYVPFGRSILITLIYGVALAII